MNLAPHQLTLYIILGAIIPGFLIFLYDRAKPWLKRRKNERSLKRMLARITMREEACKTNGRKPVFLYRVLPIMILPWVLCQCSEAEQKAGLGITLLELPRHVAQLAADAPPELLWLFIVAFITNNLFFDFVTYQLGHASGRRLAVNRAIGRGFNTISEAMADMEIRADKTPPTCPICQHPIEDIGASVFSAAGQVHLHCYGRVNKGIVPPAPGAPTHL